MILFSFKDKPHPINLLNQRSAVPQFTPVPLE